MGRERPPNRVDHPRNRSKESLRENSEREGDSQQFEATIHNPWIGIHQYNWRRNIKIHADRVALLLIVRYQLLRKKGVEGTSAPPRGCAVSGSSVGKDK